MSECRESKNLTDKNTVYENMYKMLKSVAEGTMDENGEGSVLYIVSERNNHQKTVAMCKLKTSEYLIFRKMREMLKVNIAKKGATANTF